MDVSGVRSSWLTVETNSLFMRSIRLRSVMSRTMPTIHGLALAGDLGYRQIHREQSAVLAQTFHFAADADDTGHAGSLVIPQVAVMGITVRIGHQHLDVADPGPHQACNRRCARPPD